MFGLPNYSFPPFTNRKVNTTFQQTLINLRAENEINTAKNQQNKAPTKLLLNLTKD
jgi:hypothetical protein